MKIKTPKISVVMSCYGAEKTVSHAIESILNQSLTEFEFIIIDDGSPDQTRKIISSFVQKDDRIVFVQNERNINLAASLNKGIRLARSGIIARMDADDESLPDRFEIQYDFLNQNPNIDVIGSNAFLKINGMDGGISKLPIDDASIRRERYGSTSIIHPTVMVRKYVFEKYGFYDRCLPWAEDSDLWLRWMDKVKFANIEEPLLQYSIKPGVDFRKMYYNHYVMFSNMRRRKELLTNIHLFIKSILSHSVKLFMN